MEALRIEVVHEDNPWIGQGFFARIHDPAGIIYVTEMWLTRTGAITDARKWCERHGKVQLSIA